MTQDRENEIFRAWRAAAAESDYFRDVPGSAMRQTVWEAVYKRCPCAEAELIEIMEKLYAMMTDPVFKKLKAEHRSQRARAHLSVVR